MKKRVFLIVMVFSLMTFLSGCAKVSDAPANDTASTSDEVSGSADVESENVESENVESENTENETETTQVEAIEMSAIDFEELLTKLPLVVVSTNYVVQDDEYKSLYPDLLETVILNNTDQDIKDAVIAIVAWDENNLPVKIKGNIDFADGTYIKEVNYSDINLAAGSNFGEGYGFAVAESIKISTFKVVPVSFTTFDGDSWMNPYYDEWTALFEGEKLVEDMKVEVIIDESQHVFEKSDAEESQESTNDEASEAELLGQLEQQELKVTETKYTIQDENYKSLYPDLLQAVLKNDTEFDIKNAVIAFVAWDENKLPVKIKGNMDFSDGSYVKLVNYSDINLVPGNTYGSESGFELDEHHTIETFKAIVVSYETFDGTTWDNPLFDDWKKLYEGKKIG